MMDFLKRIFLPTPTPLSFSSLQSCVPQILDSLCCTAFHSRPVIATPLPACWTSTPFWNDIEAPASFGPFGPLAGIRSIDMCVTLPFVLALEFGIATAYQASQLLSSKEIVVVQFDVRRSLRYRRVVNLMYQVGFCLRFDVSHSLRVHTARTACHRLASQTSMIARDHQYRRRSGQVACQLGSSDSIA